MKTFDLFLNKKLPRECLGSMHTGMLMGGERNFRNKRKSLEKVGNETKNDTKGANKH